MPTPIPTGITLETVTYNGPSRNKKNLLFLGDGFGTSDRALFDRTIDEIVNRFFRKAPFNLRGLRREFNFFKAFTPATSGITCDVDIDINGVTVPDNMGAGASIGKMVVKDSALGLMYGFPIGGTAMARLIGSKTGDEALIMDFIATLSYPAEPALDGCIPECWAKPPSGVSSDQGKDHGMVIVLINDDKYGGGGGTDYAMVCLGDDDGFPGLSSIAAGTDHNPVTSRNNYNNLYSVAIHELGHSYFKLEDEYCEVHDPVVATTANHFDGANAITRADALNGAGNFDPSLIKWNKVAFPGSPDKLISTSAFNYMNTNNKPLWERPAGTNCATLPFDGDTKYPPPAIRGKIRYPQRIIGAYEGGGRQFCGTYSPAGSCRMRSTHYDSDFCYVCKHAIIENIKPDLLNELYRRFYPK